MNATFRPLFNPDRVPLHEVLPLDTPYSFGIGISQLCNIRCKYCFHSLGQEALKQKGFYRGNMPWEIAEKIAVQLKEFPHKIKSITVAGQGEPLCNPLFPQIVKLLKTSDVADDISTITNGILLTRRLIDDILDAGLNRIFISVQGLSAAKYKEICGFDLDFDKYVANIAYLYEKSRGRCHINVKIADIALESEEDKNTFLEIFGDICDTIHIETIKPLYADVDYSNFLTDEQNQTTVSRFGRPHRKQKACYLAYYVLCVNPAGEIRTCGAPFSACPELGTIFDNTLINSWNSPARTKFLLDMLDGKRNQNEICRDCDFPNDVPYEGDEIDPYADVLRERYSKLT